MFNTLKKCVIGLILTLSCSAIFAYTIPAFISCNNDGKTQICRVPFRPDSKMHLFFSDLPLGNSTFHFSRVNALAATVNGKADHCHASIFIKYGDKTNSKEMVLGVIDSQNLDLVADVDYNQPNNGTGWRQNYKKSDTKNPWMICTSENGTDCRLKTHIVG